MNTQAIDALSWKRQLTDLRDTEVSVPSEFRDHCPNIIGKDRRIDLNALQQNGNRSFFKAIAVWSSEHLIKLLKSPGLLLLKTDHEGLNDDQLKSLYYLISKGFGKLNNRYGELFEVRDRNLDYTKEAIPVSKTNATTGFHTDSTALHYSPDIVGLLCLQQAKSGGESILANAADLFMWMNDVQPESIKVLSEPIIRDIITPGQEKNIESIQKNRFPVFSFDDNGFKFRYMKYWILSGHKRCNMEVSPLLKEALDAIEEYFTKKGINLRYTMKRGDMLFVNNNFICHNRTSYIDDIEKGIKRTLVRTWINV